MKKRETEDKQLCIAVHETYTYINVVDLPLDILYRAYCLHNTTYAFNMNLSLVLQVYL